MQKFFTGEPVRLTQTGEMYNILSFKNGYYTIVEADFTGFAALKTVKESEIEKI